MSAVTARFLFVCGALLLSAASLFADGEYQRTKDGKTTVWNNDPKPGDVAAWFGDRDREGYATRVGTLTWYTASRAVYARYFGNMVRGKFDGMVNAHSKGKTEHAIFVDGQRTTRWATGPAPSRRVARLQGAPVRPAGAAEETEGAPARKIENPPSQRYGVAGAQSASALAAGRADSSRGERSIRLRTGTAEKAPSSKSLGEQAAQGQTEAAPPNELSLQRAPPATPAVTAEPASAGSSPVAEREAQVEGPPAVQMENVKPASRRLNEMAPQVPSSETFPEQATRGPNEDAQPGKAASASDSGVARPAVTAEASAGEAPAAKETENPPSQRYSAAGAQPASAGPSRLAEPEPPAEGPGNVRQAENVQRPTFNVQRSIEEPGSVMSEPEGPPEGPRVVQADTAQPATRLLNDTPRQASSSESFPGQAAQASVEDTPSVSIQPSKESVPPPPTGKKSQAEIENSLQSFVQPPSSLLAIPETPGPAEASPRLTKEEVIRIANAAARRSGYNRADYERAEPQYNVTHKAWSVSYDQSAADGVEAAGKHFNVIVDDKTKGTVFVLRR